MAQVWGTRASPGRRSLVEQQPTSLPPASPPPLLPSQAFPSEPSLSWKVVQLEDAGAGAVHGAAGSLGPSLCSPVQTPLLGHQRGAILSFF